MAASHETGLAPHDEEPVTDAEVDEAIALLGGDAREATRALIGALHRLVSRGYTRGPVPFAAMRAASRGRARSRVH